VSALRVGLVGAGRWAEVHRDALGSVGAELVGVAVASEASAERVRRGWGVRATTELAELLRWPLEAVVIASPNYLHADHGEAALRAGKHVLIEKPMAITLEGCDRLLAAATRADRVLAVGLEMRVFTLFAAVRRLIDEGRIGRPLHLKLDLWRRPYRSGSGGWKSDPAKLGSSVLEEPIHYLDLARWYLGDPERLQAWATSRAGREGLAENLDVRLEFAGGARALVTRSIAAYGHRVTMMLVGERGALRAGWSGAMDVDRKPEVELTVHDDDGTERVAVPRESGHAFDVPLQTAAFVAAIERGQPVPANGEDGRASVALSLAVGDSLAGGSAVIELG
jgi:myo-inositol 2-dehydrogenase/D-chiro-inositol 1-dehydrogenase